MLLENNYKEVAGLPLANMDDTTPRTHFIVRGNQLFATNGHYIAFFPIKEKKAHEGSYVITKKMMLYAKKLAGKNDDLFFLRKGDKVEFKDGSTMEMPKISTQSIESFFQVVKKIIVDFKQRYKKLKLAEFGINIEYLDKISKAMSSSSYNSGGTYVAVWSESAPEPGGYGDIEGHPVLFLKPGDQINKAWSVIMPLKLDGLNYSNTKKGK